MATKQGPRWLLASTVLALFLVAVATMLLVRPSYRQPQRRQLPYYLATEEEGNLPTVSLNSTLGFEKIYVLSLPFRDDRHDEFALLSSEYGFNIERVDGVRPDELYGPGQPTFADDVTPTEQACWRAHVRIWRKMVEEGIETAMILEDDADFDIHLREALERLQRPLHALFGLVQDDHATPLPSVTSPWMQSEWDMLYLGACMEYPFARHQVDSAQPLTKGARRALVGEQAPYVVYHDPTVADLSDSKMPETLNYYGALGLDLPERVLASDEHPHDPEYDLPGQASTLSPTERLRVVGKTHSPWCLTSYTLTRRGALRLLYLATRHVEDAVDWQTIRASSSGWINSYTVYPPLFDQFKMVNSSWNSDINVDAHKNVERRGRRWSPSKGRARHIRRSARREQGKGRAAAA